MTKLISDMMRSQRVMASTQVSTVHGWRPIPALTPTLAALLTILFAVSTLLADSTSVDLKKLSLEELVNIEVTSVSKKAEKLSQAPAAVFVITSEDIKRSGATTIAEALRMAPGVHVARIANNYWAITARGFNGNFANKLLVLIDGRSVYTPLFSGVYWDMQDVLLEDIDRIEVIRGPGATLWGANAVNGVINIITRASCETQGGLVTSGAGNTERGFGSFRYGGELGVGAHYRIYGKYSDRDNMTVAGGGDMYDRWHTLRAGLRIDWDLNERDAVMFRGDFHNGDAGAVYNLPAMHEPWTEEFVDDASLRGGNILGRWSRRLSSSSDLTMQVYFDRTERYDVYSGETRSTIDLEFQHGFKASGRVSVMWGIGYRAMADDIDSTGLLWMDPRVSHDDVVSAFVQTDVNLIPNKLRLVLGSKFEHNNFTGNEVQPSGRFLWRPHPRHAVWGAVAHAVRTPSRAERDIRVLAGALPPFTDHNPGPLPVKLVYAGDEQYESEELYSYELGYRARLGSNLSVDMALFRNHYTSLRSVTTTGQPVPVGMPPTCMQLALRAGNGVEANTYGLEVASGWVPRNWLDFRLSYTLLRMSVEGDEASYQTEFVVSEGMDPRHQLQVRAALDLPARTRFAAAVRYVDDLPAFGFDSYTTLDARVDWHPWPSLELAVAGQNLAGPAHVEYQSELNTWPVQVERTAYGSITWRF